MPNETTLALVQWLENNFVTNGDYFNLEECASPFIIIDELIFYECPYAVDNNGSWNVASAWRGWWYILIYKDGTIEIGNDE